MTVIKIHAFLPLGAAYPAPNNVLAPQIPSRSTTYEKSKQVSDLEFSPLFYIQNKVT